MQFTPETHGQPPADSPCRQPLAVGFAKKKKLENFANFANPNPHPSSQPRDAQAADQQVLPARTLELVLREGFTKPGRSFEE